MALHDGRLYMFYGGNYNNAPQQIGVAVSEDGVRFRRLSGEPFVRNGPPGSWNSSESGHPYLFQDDDGRDYLFFQGNATTARPGISPCCRSSGRPAGRSWPRTGCRRPLGSTEEPPRDRREVLRENLQVE